MMPKLLRLAQFGAFGLCSFYFGIKFERNNSTNLKLKQKWSADGNIKNKPGLPLFGTVSAAAPFTEGTSTRTLWRICKKIQKLGFSKSYLALDHLYLKRKFTNDMIHTCVSQIMKFGFPSLDNVRSYDDFVLAYDQRNRVPHWVFEHITKDHVKRNDTVDRSKCDFKPDESIHPFFRSQNSDYKGSGFDRGHMAAAGNHRLHQKHVEQTFLLTNMAPQVGAGFNRDAWNNLERYIRKLTKQYENVYICTGPLYLPRREADGKNYVKYQVLGVNTVAVPTHFYKVVVGEGSDGTLDMEAYVMPNQKIPDDTPLQVFQVAPETIERAAGVLFFDKIHRSKLTRINGKKI